MAKKRVYISGPISGLEREEYLARFAEAERWLQGHGYDVCNPCRLAPCRWPWLYRIIGYRLTLWYDVLHLLFCDYIAMLPGWMNSRGALYEFEASNDMGIPYIPDFNAFNLHMRNFITSKETKETKA